MSFCWHSALPPAEKLWLSKGQGFIFLMDSTERARIRLPGKPPLSHSLLDLVFRKDGFLAEIGDQVNGYPEGYDIFEQKQA
jgi:hypothetical protein